jgi:hypothetical protein
MSRMLTRALWWAGLGLLFGAGLVAGLALAQPAEAAELTSQPGDPVECSTVPGPSTTISTVVTGPRGGTWTRETTISGPPQVVCRQVPPVLMTSPRYGQAPQAETMCDSNGTCRRIWR